MVLLDFYSRLKFQTTEIAEVCKSKKKPYRNQKKKKRKEKTLSLHIPMTQYNLIFMPAFDLVKQTTLHNQGKFS